MQQKIYYTYKITLLCGSWKGRYYYGQHSTTNLNDGYAGSGAYLWKFYKKYGAEEGKTYRKEILQFYNSREELNEAEAKLVQNLYETDPNCLNRRAGGNQPGCSEGTRQKIRVNMQKFAQKHVGPFSEEVTKRRLKASIETQIKKYGKAGGQFTKDALVKSKQTRISKYGSSTNCLHTKEAKQKNRETRLKMYGSFTGPMNTLEVKAAKYSRRLRRMTITRSKEFLDWYDNSKYGYKFRAIPDYLELIGKTLEDFEEYKKCDLKQMKAEESEVVDVEAEVLA